MSISKTDVPVNLPVKLTKRQQQIIEIIKRNPSVTTNELAKQFQVSEKTIKRDFAMLKEDGVIIRIGSDKSGQWKIKEQ
jgi:Predicted transcriptional regulator containing an HTH domain and an uncharacterized domain shared with the mammalian protein Schlafen